MEEDKRAFFSKSILTDGKEPRTFYSMSLRNVHWAWGIVASILGVVLALMAVRSAVFASVRSVAKTELVVAIQEARKEDQAETAKLVDAKLQTAIATQDARFDQRIHAVELTAAETLIEISAALSRLEAQYDTIEKQLDRLETSQ